MRFVFSLEPMVDMLATQKAGKTVYAKQPKMVRGKTVYEKVPKLDDAGAEVLDAQGNPVLEEDTTRPVMLDVNREMVHVIFPGDRNAVHFTSVEQYRAERNEELALDTNPKAVAAVKAGLDYFERCYQAWKSGVGLESTGTPLQELAALSKGMIHKLLENNVSSLEDLVNLSDSQVQQMGMGMARFKAMAEQHLANKAGVSDTVKLASQLATMEENAKAAELRHQEDMRRLQAQLDAANAAAAQQPQPQQ